MAKSTFSGPVQSLAGFISAGNANVVSLTADTSLTVASHAGKVLITNDADGKFTLPSIVATAPGADDDPNQTNNLGATFTFIVVTAATDMDILTDGTDKFVGGLYTGVDDATGKTFISGSTARCSRPWPVLRCCAMTMCASTSSTAPPPWPAAR